LYYSNDGNQAQQTAFRKENAHEIKAKTTKRNPKQKKNGKVKFGCARFLVRWDRDEKKENHKI